MFAGGRLSLDFVNTLCMRRGKVLEFLGHPEALHKWLRSVSVFTGHDLGPLDEPIDQDLLARALELRVAIHDLVLGVIQKEVPPEKALKTLNQALRSNPAYPQIAASGNAFTASITTKKEAERWLTAIAEDAADLLANGDLSLLRQCGADTCVRVFFDTTKNHKRRWCVEKCGSRIKSAAYYERKRGVRKLGS